jgi:hypothetical protein
VRSALIVAAATGQPFLARAAVRGARARGRRRVGAVVRCGRRRCATGRIQVSASSSWRPTTRRCASASCSRRPDVDHARRRPASARQAGGRIMPAVAIYLEPEQGFARHPIARRTGRSTRSRRCSATPASTRWASARGDDVRRLARLRPRHPGRRPGRQALYTLGTIIDAGGLRDRGRRRDGRRSSAGRSRSRRVTSHSGSGSRRSCSPSRACSRRSCVRRGSRISSSTATRAAHAQDQERERRRRGQLPDVLQREPRPQTSADPEDRRLVQYVIVSGAGDNGDGTITLNLNATVTGTVDDDLVPRDVPPRERRRRCEVVEVAVRVVAVARVVQQ